jgi:hypothetical protein
VYFLPAHHARAAAHAAAERHIASLIGTRHSASTSNMDESVYLLIKYSTTMKMIELVIVFIFVVILPYKTIYSF